MARFIPYNRDQDVMVVINYSEQLQAGTFEYAAAYLIDHKLDLSLFAEDIKNDDGGRPAYDPAILLKIILFAYSRGITSSREIQWCCKTNIIFKALSCDSEPHFTTIAHFVSSHSKAIEDLFEQVLLICNQQGLLGHELFAIDGCKLPSNAAKEWSGTFKELESKRRKLRKLIHHHIQAHQRLDKNEPEQEERARRIKQSINTLDSAFAKVDQFLKTNSPRMGQGKRPAEVKSNITDNESAKMTTSKGTIQGYNGVAAVDRKHQIIIDAQAFGEGQEHHTLQPVLERIRSRYQRLGISENIYTQGTIVTADTGFSNEKNMEYVHNNSINAYIPDNRFRSRDPKFNAQKSKYPRLSRAATDNVVVIPASEFQFDPVNMQCICPAGNSISFRGIHNDELSMPRAFFTGRLNQCRHCEIKSRCMKTPASADHRKGNGRQVSFPLSNQRGPTYTDWMKLRIDSEHGKQVYSHRMSVVEPVFGNITANKKLKRFSLRGKTKVNAQWRLFCLIHNIEKLANYSAVAA